MSISSVTSNLSQYVQPSTQGSNPFQQLRQDFQSLGTALQSGNLSSAQSAYGQMQQVFQGVGAPATSATVSLSSTAGASGSFRSQMANLGSDLQSGNLPAAQSTYSSIMSQVQSHHHSGGAKGMGGGMQSAGVLSSTSGSTSGSTTSGSLIQDLLNTSSAPPSTSGTSTSGSVLQNMLQQLVQSLQSSMSAPRGGTISTSV